MDIEPSGEGAARVTWRARGATEPTRAQFGAVVNCTGPSSDLHRVTDPLIAHLREAGQLQIDPLSLGLAVDDHYRVLRADGVALKSVRYVGPLLKAQRWEATAVPELRGHAKGVAQRLIPPYT